ncbi:Zn-dependent metalloprotease [Streptomyces turgidiscabies]|uniref:Zn-dependent metalloprotease n=1 Tax=Streptomyces turgidiscabies TaxID=85558 RepID=A0ABU0RNK6_9ACTN|nr:Zn-dependent metalloprotease [Streptomyces turgidiscabies]
MGTLVEFYAENSQDTGDYLIGAKIVRSGFPRDALRYMDKPSRDGDSADYWSSSVANLSVHYSSGVANHFAYLLAEGSGAKTINGVSYNSPTYNRSTVTGIGRAKLGAIWYRALTVYMTSSTNSRVRSPRWTPSVAVPRLVTIEVDALGGGRRRRRW